jgi:hypothetical protein
MSWAESNFGRAELDDIRRVERAVYVAQAMALSPGKSINQLFLDRYDMKAAYNLFKREDATPDNLQAGHRQLTMNELHKSPGHYLLLEDTSEISFSGREPIEGLGPIGEGNEGQQGFLLHSVLAVRYEESSVDQSTEEEQKKRPDLEVLGLCDQQFYIRQRRPAGERRRDSMARQHRARESQLWEKATSRIGRAPAADNELISWVRVGDRGADIYEHLLGCRRMGHGFLIRATQSRALVGTEAGGHGRRSGELLFDYARSLPALSGEISLRLRGRLAAEGRKRRREMRVARLKVSAAEVELSAPARPGSGPGKGESIKCTVVRVWEEVESLEDGERPLEWLLLTSSRVDGFEAARSIARQYSSRWLIEEFHKALKSGMGAERLQLESKEGLFAAIAMMSVVALRLVRIKEQVRIDAKKEAVASGLNETELEVLHLASKRKLETVGDVALAIGRLGGHLNRKSDGMPGMVTLWRGMNRLADLVDGYLLARNLHQFG